ncbi:MAG: hypothetical protein RLZZ70_195 [Candidatus Parcubacteria bacterium]|jgi:hypothetical protein
MANAAPSLAKSVAAVINGTDSVAKHILDRSTPLTEEFVRDVLSLLQIGYPGRRPRALVDRKGRPRPTDMDLASFLVHLMQKPTVLELPAYTTALPRQVCTGDRHLDGRRHGHLLALSSHREHLSFGVTIEDMSIMHRTAKEEDTLGRPSTFLIVSYQGIWHQGWKGISWKFRSDEEQFRNRYDLSTDTNHQGYQYFVHPNRRHSIFSRAHLLLKLLWLRIEDELRQLPMAPDTANVPAPASKVGPAKSEMVPTFTMQLTGLPLSGEYQTITADAVQTKVRWLTKMRTQVQFYVRANEFAFYQYGREKDFVAHWIRNGSWQHLPTNDQYRHHAVLQLGDGVSLSYTVDLVSKSVAAH